MRPLDSSVVLRPRGLWEAMDLGILLARRHAGLLMLAWALPSLPLLALLGLLLWEKPGWALLIFWWLKPLGERLPLFILSRAVFGQTPTLSEALRALPGLLRRELLVSLTWRRFNPARSFDLPALLLEGLSGKELQQRRAILAARRGKRGAAWLTLVGMHLEMALWLGALAFLYLLLPSQASAGLDWRSLLEAPPADWLWLEHLTNGLYALVLMVWEPVYVACGFSLYLNRRIHLEAWDLELAFQRLRQRLGTAACMLLMASGLLLVQFSGDALAEPAPPHSVMELDRQAAHKEIESLLGHPPFSRREEITRWRFGEPHDQLPEIPQPSPLKMPGRAAATLEVLLWLAVAAGAMLLAWRYRDWLAAFAERSSPSSRRQQPAAVDYRTVLPGASPLPANLMEEAEYLWDVDPGQALALLYRALLVHLSEDFHLRLSEGDTEGEVLRRVRHLNRPELLHLAETLIPHWQNLAYGHCYPPAELKNQLLGAWRQQFGSGSRA